MCECEISEERRLNRVTYTLTEACGDECWDAGPKYQWIHIKQWFSISWTRSTIGTPKLLDLVDDKFLVSLIICEM